MTVPADIFRRLDRELWVVTAHADGEQAGLIATGVCEASIVESMPRVLVALARQHYTWDVVDRARGFALHLLRPDQAEIAWRFGTASGRELDKFAGLDIGSTPDGHPQLQDCLAWLDCRIEAEMETGDRTVWLAGITACGEVSPGPALTVNSLLLQLDSEQRALLLRQLEEDAARDSKAIADWRAERQSERGRAAVPPPHLFSDLGPDEPGA